MLPAWLCVPKNHTPASAVSFDSSNAPVTESYAASLALVRARWECAAAEVSSLPAASVSTTWLSPVVSLVMRNATPPIACPLSPSTFSNERSPRTTWLAKGSSHQEISPAVRTSTVWMAESRRYPVPGPTSQTR